jgi:hypothetical protein
MVRCVILKRLDDASEECDGLIPSAVGGERVEMSPLMEDLSEDERDSSLEWDADHELMFSDMSDTEPEDAPSPPLGRKMDSLKFPFHQNDESTDTESDTDVDVSCEFSIR